MCLRSDQVMKNKSENRLTAEFEQDQRSINDIQYQNEDLKQVVNEIDYIYVDQSIK